MSSELVVSNQESEQFQLGTEQTNMLSEEEQKKCLPSFNQVANALSPRTYFTSLTPRTKQDVGAENYQDTLTTLKEDYPNASNADLVSFIRINNGDYAKSKELYAKAVAWREEILPVDKSTCTATLEKGMFFFAGQDLEGRQVAYFRMAGHDPKTRDLQEILRAIVYQVETKKAEMGDREFQVVVIIDRNNVTNANTDKPLMKEFFDLFAEKYPNKLNKVLVAPANLFFRTFWAGIKFTLPERIRNKVSLLAAQKDLQKFISEDQLHTSMGGKNEYDWTSIVN
jgi:hypothetical protein